MNRFHFHVLHLQDYFDFQIEIDNVSLISIVHFAKHVVDALSEVLLQVVRVSNALLAEKDIVALLRAIAPNQVAIRVRVSVIVLVVTHLERDLNSHNADTHRHEPIIKAGAFIKQVTAEKVVTVRLDVFVAEKTELIIVKQPLFIDKDVILEAVKKT